MPVTIQDIEVEVRQAIFKRRAEMVSCCEELTIKDLVDGRNLALCAMEMSSSDFVSKAVATQAQASRETKCGYLFDDLFCIVVRRNHRLTLVACNFNGKCEGLNVDAVVFDNSQKCLFFVEIKSGTNWGNSSQWGDLVDKFKKAKEFIKDKAKVNEEYAKY